MKESPHRPNVIWVFGDQHRAQSVGYAGDPNRSTPNFDRFASEGAVFNRAVAGFPLCCPFRGALLSGRYPHHAVPGHERQLPPDRPTIAQPLREAGYRTSYFGKWHLDGYNERNGRAAFHVVPPERRGGFDDWLGYENNNSQWDCWVHGAGHPEPWKLPGYETDAMTDIFIDYLRARGREQMDPTGSDYQPFFAVLSVQPPHDPYIAPEEWMGRHAPGRVELRPNVPKIPWVEQRARRQLAGYHGMIENFDWNFGRIRQALDEGGLTGNTVIFFFSDHGDMHGSHGQFGKTSPFEESIRVPFIIGGETPFYFRRNGLGDHPINHVDVSATTLGMCGLPVPEWMMGTDYSICRKGGSGDGISWPDSAYLQAVIPTMHPNSVDRPWRGVVTRDGWKYVALEGQPYLLFNLNEDPCELANHAHNVVFATERKRLHDRLRQWIDDTGDSFELPNL